MKKFQQINLSIENRIASITLNRPEYENTLNDTILEELKEVINYVEQAEEVKLVVLKAAGQTFCSGLDVSYLQKMQGLTMDENLADSSAFAQILIKIYRSTKVFIAQVEGNVSAEGCGLATVCDFVFAIPEVIFTYKEVKIGLVAAISMPFLLRKVGETRTKQLLLSGESFSAQKACDFHLISDVISSDEIETFVDNFAMKLCSENSSVAMQLTKKMIADIQEFPLEHAVKFSAKMNAYARVTEDSQKGIQASLNKSKIEW